MKLAALREIIPAVNFMIDAAEAAEAADSAGQGPVGVSAAELRLGALAGSAMPPGAEAISGS